MNLKRLATKRSLVLGTIALAVTLGAGAAVAATSDVFDPEAEQEAFQAAVAEKLGVTTDELQDAYEEASLEQLDAAVAAGRLTAEQADAIRERVESGTSSARTASASSAGRSSAATACECRATISKALPTTSA